MIDSYKVVTAQCDNENPTKDCHGEIVIRLEENETVEQATSFLQMNKWFIDLDMNDKGETEVLGCICPYCNSKVKKNKSKLKIVKDEKD
jgi:hypothetical protein